MALIIVSSGTTASADGTAIGSSGARIPLTYDTTWSGHFRDEGDFAADDLAFTMPSGITLSLDESTWYAGSSATGFSTSATNSPLYLKQTEFAADSSAALTSFTSLGLFDEAYTSALGQVTGLTLTVTGSTTASASWSAVANASSYLIQWSTASDFSSVTASATPSATSQAITGLTAGTTYYARVKGQASGYTDGAYSATASATTPYALSSSVSGSGSVTVSGNVYVVDAYGADADAAIVYLNANLSKGTNYAARFKNTQNAAAGATFRLSIINKTTAPTVDTNTNFNAIEVIHAGINANGDMVTYYYTNTGSVVYYNHGTGAWGSNAVYDGTLDTYFTVVIETSSTQWRYILKGSDDSTVITTSPWIDWSATRSQANGLWALVGEPLTNFYQASGTVDYIKTV